MRDLTRNELAAVKRVAATTKSLRTKRDKLYTKVNELKKLIADLDAEILAWESPIIAMTGFTSDKVLDGTWKREDVEEVAAEFPEEMIAEIPYFVINEDIINN